MDGKPSSFSPDGDFSPAGPGRPLRFLIVEDDFLIAMDIGMIVEEAGHVVAGTAASRDEAIARAGETRADAAFMDLRLAGGSCGAAAARVLRDRFGMRVIFLSGNLTPAKRQELAALDPIAMVNKPFTPRALVVALAAAREALGPDPTPGDDA